MWQLNKLFRSAKPQPLPHVAMRPRCTCGRFCSTHEAPHDIIGKLVSALTAKGSYVPPLLRSRSLERQGP